MIGETLGHYKVVSKLGEGGMGEVFVAEDPKLKRNVALKILPPEMAKNPDRRARFEREAQAVAALNHPNIVHIYSVEEASGYHFLTMELVEGKTLSELLPRDGFKLEKLFEIALPLSDALAAAHQKGIVHRDLKPANIMVDNAGRVKVLDFGLAKLREGFGGGGTDTQLATASVTEEGKILGTAQYMSPEQAQGQTVDSRSDVFSLGIILYEMISGQRPFEGDTAISTISSILKDQPRSITELNASLPRHLGRIVRRSLSKDPQRRYQSALDLRNELQELKEEINSGELALPSLPTAAAQPSRRVGLWLGLAAVALATVSLVIVLRSRTTSPSDAASSGSFDGMQFTRLTQTGLVGDAAISPDGNYVAYSVRDDAGQGALWVRQVATDSDVEIVPADRTWPWDIIFSPDGNYIYYNKGVWRESRADLYRIPVLGGTPRRIMEDIEGRVSFSPDGTRMVFLRRRREAGSDEVIVANADGSDSRTVAARALPAPFSGGPWWSPQGDRIAASVLTWENGPHHRLVTFPAEGGEETPVLSEAWKSFRDCAWALDGSGLFCGANRSWFGGDQLWFFSYPDGVPSRITNDVNDYDRVSATADGRTLLATQSENRSSIWVAPRHDLSAFRQVVAESRENPGRSGLDWTQEGDLVFTAFNESSLKLRIVPGTGGTPQPISQGDHVEVQPTVTADGRVVFTSELGGSINTWIQDLDGTNRRQLTTGVEVSGQVAPSGEWVVYDSLETGAPTLWKVPIDGGDPVLLVDRPHTQFGLSPDGSRIVLRVVDPETNRYETEILSIEGKMLESITGIPSAPTWGPVGEMLVFVKPDEPVANLWAWPLDGSEPYQLTNFDDPELGICNRRWSNDGEQLAVVRCRSTKDAVLISDFR